MNKVFGLTRKGSSEEINLLLDKINLENKKNRIFSDEMLDLNKEIIKLGINIINEKIDSSMFFWSSKNKRFIEKIRDNGLSENYYEKRKEYEEITYNSGIKWKNLEYLLLKEFKFIPFLFQNIIEKKDYTNIVNNCIRKYSLNHNFLEVFKFSHEISKLLNHNDDHIFNKNAKHTSLFTHQEKYIIGVIHVDNNLFINGQAIQELKSDYINKNVLNVKEHLKNILNGKYFSGREESHIEAMNDYSEYLSFLALNKSEYLTQKDNLDILDEIIRLSRNNRYNLKEFLKVNVNTKDFLYKMLSENNKESYAKFNNGISQELRGLIEDIILDDKGKKLISFEEELTVNAIQIKDNYYHKIVLGKIAVKKFFPQLHKVQEMNSGLLVPLFKVFYGEDGLEITLISKNKTKINKEFFEDLEILKTSLKTNLSGSALKENREIVSSFYRMIVLKNDLDNIEKENRLIKKNKI